MLRTEWWAMKVQCLTLRSEAKTVSIEDSCGAMLLEFWVAYKELWEDTGDRSGTSRPSCE